MQHVLDSLLPPVMVTCPGNGNTPQEVTKGTGTDNPTGITEGMFKAHVYPNPSTTQFTLQLESSSREDVELIVSNMLGEKVYEGKGGIG